MDGVIKAAALDLLDGADTTKQSTNEEYTGRIVIGLFGDDAPLATREFLKYASVPYGGDGAFL